MSSFRCRPSAPEAGEVDECIAALELAVHSAEGRAKSGRINRVEDGPHLRIAGHVVDAKERAEVVFDARLQACPFEAEQ